MKFRKLLLFLFFAFHARGNAQTPHLRFEHLSVDQGLSQSSVTSILRDRRGFMWFGTQDGLNKYDGVKFQNYRHYPGESSRRRSNFVHLIYEDRFGEIWIAFEGNGLSIFNPRTERFTYFDIEDKVEQRRSAARVRAIDEDAEGNLWVATGAGVWKFDRAERMFVESSLLKGTSEYGEKLSFLIDSRQQFWLGCERGGPLRLDARSGLFLPALVGEISGLGEKAAVTKMYEDSGGDIWFIFESGELLRLDQTSGRSKRYRLNHAAFGGGVTCLAEDSRGNIWAGAYSRGLLRFDRTGEVLTDFRHDSYDPQSLSNDHILSLLIDENDLVWVGTAGGGVNLHNPLKEKFRHYKNSLRNPEALEGGMVWSLFEDSRGLLWIGTMSGGLNVLDRETGEFTVYKHDPGDPGSISSNTIYSICEDRRGNIWAATGGAGLNKLNRRSGKFQRFSGNPKSADGLLSNSIRSIIAGKSGYLWLATLGGGLHRLDPESGVFEHYLHDENDASSIGSNVVTALMQDSKGFLWVGVASGGVDRFDPATQRFRRYCKEQEAEPLGSDNVMALAEDSRGRIWVGTYYGLFVIDPGTAEIKAYTTRDGLPNDVVYGILVDGRDRLWLSTNNGISRFDSDAGKFRNFGVEDGLQSAEFDAGAAFRNKDGEMFFGGVNGFNIFHPDSIADNPLAPQVAITAIKRFNRNMQLPENRNIPVEFSYRDYLIQFEFVALDYTNPLQNQYAYRLDGLNEDWIYCGAERQATFTNLAPGAYTFRVKGANHDGVWNESGASVRFVVTPPFWQSWWFRWLAVAMACTVALFTDRLMRRRIRRAAELKQKFSELKLQALRSQMNPHFVFNTINSIQYFISSRDQKSAYHYLSQFASLMRMVLDDSSRATHPVAEELKALKLYLELESLRFEGKFSYTLEVDPKIDLHNTEIPSLLIQPFVENAIQHGLRFKRTRGALRISLSAGAAAVICLIEDNGIGIGKGRALKDKLKPDYKSTGMQVTQERLQTLNEIRGNGRAIEVVDLSLGDGSRQGTRVKIVIPVEA